jgi:hypothetical protein
MSNMVTLDDMDDIHIVVNASSHIRMGGDA